MSSWNEIHIAFVYFAGLFSAIVTGSVILLYLRPIKKTINKIIAASNGIIPGSFKTSILLAALLGAMSVTFTDCDGGYDHLLESKTVTIMKGLEQVSASFEYLTMILGLWLIIFVILKLSGSKSLPSERS